MKSIGRHMIMEMWGCSGLNSTDIVEQALREVTEAAGAVLLDLIVRPYTPQGVTGVAVVSESHVMIHTWPEYSYAAVDVFTCGKKAYPAAAMPILKRLFSPERVQVMEMTRGIFSDD
ncbi:MAG: adenosylmethionine decarboxylase [Chloroflexota bacterium]|nr:MAG: adenosylmethionine decarboxylase [Chloroflexota bacterium]